MDSKPGQMGSNAGQADRGQVIVVVALLLATAFVALALILNSAIYAENLSTRETADSIAVSGAVSAAERDVEGAIRQVNGDHGTLYTDLEDNLEDIIHDRRDASTDRHATRGAMYDLTFVDATDGTQVRQNVSRNFTNEQGDSTWTIVEGANGVRDFRVNVSETDLVKNAEGNVDRDADFHVFADNGTSSIRAYIYDNDGVNVTVTVDGEELNTCETETTSHVVVDLTEGTLGGTSCEALSLTTHQDEDWDAIGYNNTLDETDDPQVTGGYGLVVKDGVIESTDFASIPNSPFAVDAVYDATIEVTYARSDITYDRTIRIVPGAEA